MSEVRAQLIQRGIIVVDITAPDHETATREALHYAGQYAEDGPVILKITRAKSKKRIPDPVKPMEGE